jgi:diguanylate cyclase
MMNVAIDKHLRDALKNDELQITFKPVFSAQHVRQVRFVLVPCWISPELGAIEYGEIENTCERIGVQAEFWDFYFARTCATLAGWKLRGKALPKISLTLPRRYLERCELPRVVDRLTGLYALKPDLFLLQMSEQTALDRTPLATHNIAALREMGVGLGISGFRSLRDAIKVFANLHPELVLLDHATMRGFISRNVKTALPQIVAIARGMGCVLAVDGVRSLSECSEMLHSGFSEIAGPFVGDPISARTVETFYI